MRRSRNGSGSVISDIFQFLINSVILGMLGIG